MFPVFRLWARFLSREIAVRVLFDFLHKSVCTARTSGERAGPNERIGRWIVQAAQPRGPIWDR